MARFAISRSQFGSFPTVVLTDTVSGANAVVTLRGATLNAYSVPHAGGLLDVVAGYETPEDLAALKASRSRIMAPWSNRIQHSRYRFGGDRPLELPKNPEKPHILHGFVGGVDFEVVAERVNTDGASVTFTTNALRPGAFEGYPYRVDVEVTYALTADRLVIEIAGQNVGEGIAPFGCGWHPYFRTGSENIDHLRLAVPCRRKIVTDAELIPLPGEAAFQSIDQAGPLDFRPDAAGNGKPIGDLFIDGAFLDLAEGPDHLARSWVRDDRTGVTLTVFQQGGLMHVYTGDRRSLAMEPVQFMTNAFNRPEWSDAIQLRPGQESRFVFGVEVGK
ncbi:MAG: aldose epimerase [Phycisphaerae bacterium]|nr:aldose epimerase [Phycisphaerae bacterium]